MCKSNCRSLSAGEAEGVALDPVAEDDPVGLSDDDEFLVGLEEPFGPACAGIGGHASRTNQHREGSVGWGRDSVLLRSSHAERHQPVAPLPVPMNTPDED